jgi:hypothetical protein
VLTRAPPPAPLFPICRDDEMAKGVNKTKKAAEGINAKLQLVIKSGA